MDSRGFEVWPVFLILNVILLLKELFKIYFCLLDCSSILQSMSSARRKSGGRLQYVLLNVHLWPAGSRVHLLLNPSNICIILHSYVEQISEMFSVQERQNFYFIVLVLFSL